MNAPYFLSSFLGEIGRLDPFLGADLPLGRLVGVAEVKPLPGGAARRVSMVSEVDGIRLYSALFYAFLLLEILCAFSALRLMPVRDVLF